MHPQFLLKTLSVIYRKDINDLKDIVDSHMDAETIEQMVKHIGSVTNRSMEQGAIVDQQLQIKHLTEMVEYLHHNTHSVMLHWRGIDPNSNTLCDECDGSGTQVETNDENNALNENLFYPNPCPKCKGSGDTANIWEPLGKVGHEFGN